MSRVLGVLRNWVNTALAYLALIGIWQLIASAARTSWIVGPIDILRAFLDKAFLSRLVAAYTDTLIRSLTGFAGGLVLGVSLGVLTGLFSMRLGGVFESLASLAASVPGVAWIPLLIAIMGINSFLLPVTASILASFPPIFYQIYSALRSIDPSEVEVAITLGADNRFLWRTIIMPKLMASLFPALKIEAVLAWKIVFAVEMIAATSGLGYLAMMYADLLDVPHVAVLVIVLTLSVALMVKLVSLLEKLVLGKLGLGVEQWGSIYTYVEQEY